MAHDACLKQRMWNLNTALKKWIFVNLKSHISGMVKGLASVALTHKTRVRFPVSESFASLKYVMKPSNVD